MIINTNVLELDKRSGLPIPAGTCGDPDCERRAVSFAYSERLHALIPACRRHIDVYEVDVNDRRVWQAEDEYADLQFARRSRWAWLAQRRILHDQRVARRGRTSIGQRRLEAKRARRDVDARREAIHTIDHLHDHPHPAARNHETLAYVDKSLDNVADLDPDLTWTNTEVIQVLEDIRSLLLTGNIAPGMFEHTRSPGDGAAEPATKTGGRS